MTEKQSFMAHDGLVVKRFPHALRQQARIAALVAGIPLNQWVVRTVERAIEQEKGEREKEMNTLDGRTSLDDSASR